MTGDRREAMLATLLEAMTRHHGRRRAARRGLAAAALTLAAGLAWMTSVRVEPPLPAPAAFVRVVRSCPRSGVVRRIGDDELVRRLAEIHRPAGLIRMGGVTRLTADVVSAPAGDAAIGPRYHVARVASDDGCGPDGAHRVRVKAGPGGGARGCLALHRGLRRGDRGVTSS